MLQPDEIQEHAAHADAEVREYRIFGPPGTGKTTNLSRQVRRAAERFGEGSVLVTSFSKAAAAELAGRGLPIQPDRVGTLHSHCWRALGSPAIAEANVDEWNHEHPSLQITPTKKEQKLNGEEAIVGDDDSVSGKDGDVLLQQLGRFRGMMMPPETWNAALREFATLWTSYKESLGLLDFTDLIEHALTDTWAAPGNPSVIFADEAQDLNRMELALIRRWGEHAHHFIVCADDDQTIYGWCGATPDAVLDPPIPDENVIVLKQSYRVPRAVHAKANALIHNVSRRQEKEYLPRDFEGSVERIKDRWKAPEFNILRETEERLTRGQTVMFLAPCSYMLAPYIAVLRKAGIPFHNPYRRSNGAWNPLAHTQPGSSSNRLLALLAPHPVMGENAREWTFGDVNLWCQWLTSQGILKHGAKKQIAAMQEHSPVTIQDLDKLFSPAALDSMLAAFEGDYKDLMEWWRARVVDTHRARLDFPVAIAAKRGPAALVQEPLVTVGTIHSVKGGEADAVFLVPDLSAAGSAAHHRGGASKDAVIRLFYVGLTRARESVYICAAESAGAARL
jgi:superfamily I DNA/RNA helicase